MQQMNVYKMWDSLVPGSDRGQLSSPRLHEAGVDVATLHVRGEVRLVFHCDDFPVAKVDHAGNKIYTNIQYHSVIDQSELSKF